MNQELAEMPLDDVSPEDLTPLQEKPDAVPVPHLLVPHLKDTAILLDIDGTLLDLMPTPREVWVPPGLRETLNGSCVINSRTPLALVKPECLISQTHLPGSTSIGAFGRSARISDTAS